MSNTINRRPLKTRSNNLAVTFAKWISSKNITPNQISILSIVAAAIASYSLLHTQNSEFRSFWLIISVVFIQGRLLCNLLDGMVAVEGGKGTPAGELFNDIPDRIADSIILIALGYTVGSPLMGWCAALIAVMSAYVRVLAISTGAPTSFTGPMAKPHRMALVSFACVLSCFESSFTEVGNTLYISLFILIIGSVITVYRRTVMAYKFLEGKVK